MPAPSSSRIDRAIAYLADLAKDVGDAPVLLAVLARVADPRHQRGVL
jgi:hypothetical protein